MRKLIALFLVLVLCFGLCACAQQNDEYEEYEDLIDHLEDKEYQEAIAWILELAAEEEAKKPTQSQAQIAKQEEYEQLCRYLDNLEESLQEGWSFSIDYTPEDTGETVWLDGSAAYLHLYERLTAMGDYEDCEALAARFTVLDGKLLNVTETYTDALGNRNEYVSENYTYNAEGTLVSGPAPEEYEDLFWGTPNYEFDASGRLVCLRSINYDDTVEAVLNITYNADGTVASYNFKDAGGRTVTCTYTYEGSVLTRCDIADSYFDTAHVVTYFYNEAGQLEHTESTSAEDNSYSRYVDVVAYTYDAAGRVASKRVSQFYYWDGTLEQENYVHNWEYTYDDAGNILTALDTHLGSFDVEGQQLISNLDFPKTHTYNYGTYCVYTPAN